MGDDERDRALREVETCGWWIARTTKRGYLVMRCGCGEHQETMHKTPSNPDHFRQKAARMTRTCCPDPPPRG